MINKRLPLFLVLFFNILGSGFFYAQEDPKAYKCPQGRHKGFICQCGPSKDLKIPDLKVKPVRPEKYCPRGIHDFICQCAPLNIDSKRQSLNNTIKVEEPPKNKE